MPEQDRHPTATGDQAANASGLAIPPLRRRDIVRRILDALHGYDVFLSYTRKDDPGSAFASSLHARLTSPIGGKPLRCFLDVGDMPNDESLRRAIVRRIRASRVLLVLAGPHALDHDWVCFEVEVAQRYGRRIMILDHGADWPTCTGRLKSLLPERVQIDCRGTAPHGSSSDEDEASIRAQIGARRVETTRARVWSAVVLTLVAMLLTVTVLLVRQKDLTQAEHAARSEAENNFALAKRIVDESFTIAAFELKDVPGIGAYRDKLLTKALRFYRGFLLRKQQEELDRDYAQALLNLGLVEWEQGRDPGTNFRRAWNFLNDVTKSETASFEARHLLFLSCMNTGIAMLEADKPTEAEPMLRRAIELGTGLRNEPPDERSVDLHFWMAHMALGRSMAEQSRPGDAATLFTLAIDGLQSLHEAMSSGRDGAFGLLAEQVAERLAGAHYNVAQVPSLPLAARLRAATESWRRWELLMVRAPTNNRLVYRTAQANGLLASVTLEHGDAGNAQVFAERSLLIYHGLAQHYTNNATYRREFEQQLAVVTGMPAWQRPIRFHEVELNLLEGAMETDLGTDEQRRDNAHRVTLTHVQIAATLLRRALSGVGPPPSPEDKEKARGHLAEAKKINARIAAEATVPPIAVRVMRRNLPMWSDFAR